MGRYKGVFFKVTDVAVTQFGYLKLCQLPVHFTFGIRHILLCAVQCVKQATLSAYRVTTSVTLQTSIFCPQHSYLDSWKPVLMFRIH